MRRTAVSIGLLLAVASIRCTDKLYLPANGVDGGTGPRPDATGAGGRGNASGGSFGQGGRGGPGGPDGDGGSRGMVGCGGGPLPVAIKLTKAEVMISLGRNSTMSARLGDTTKMGAVERALRAVIGTHQNAVNFGYQEFPSFNPCAAGAACCAGTNPLYLPAPTTQVIEQQALRRCDDPLQPSRCTSPVDARPIDDALNILSDMWKTTDRRDRRVILIVDGDPSCGPGDPGAQTCGDRSPVPTVSELSNHDIKTHVVAVTSDPAAAPCLGNIAGQAGTGPNTPPAVPAPYPGADANQLAQSLNAIVARAADAICSINLVSPIPADLSRVSVRIEDQMVEAGGPDGWSLIQGGVPRLQLRGAACARLQRIPQVSEQDVQVFAGCP